MSRLIIQVPEPPVLERILTRCLTLGRGQESDEPFDFLRIFEVCIHAFNDLQWILIHVLFLEEPGEHQVKSRASSAVHSVQPDLRNDVANTVTFIAQQQRQLQDLLR